MEALWRLSIGTDVVPHIVFCFQMCNRLPEIMKNGDAGIFFVYYSLKTFTDVFLLISLKSNPDLSLTSGKHVHAANTRINVDIDLSFDGKLSQISHD